MSSIFSFDLKKKKSEKEIHSLTRGAFKLEVNPQKLFGFVKSTRLVREECYNMSYCKIISFHLFIIPESSHCIGSCLVQSEAEPADRIWPKNKLLNWQGFKKTLK